jgi:hypothetical protein
MPLSSEDNPLSQCDVHNPMSNITHCQTMTNLFQHHIVSNKNPMSQCDDNNLMMSCRNVTNITQHSSETTISQRRYAMKISHCQTMTNLFQHHIVSNKNPALQCDDQNLTMLSDKQIINHCSECEKHFQMFGSSNVSRHRVIRVTIRKIFGLGLFLLKFRLGLFVLGFIL